MMTADQIKQVKADLAWAHKEVEKRINGTDDAAPEIRAFCEAGVKLAGAMFGAERMRMQAALIELAAVITSMAAAVRSSPTLRDPH
jgi:hypothetical protein